MKSSLLAILLLAAPAFATDEVAKQPRTIELAICLDVSGSMSGLINSARAKLWAIVNDLALAKPTPRLRVALLTFGHSTYPQEKGWVRVDADLTDDLDRISQKLFALQTNGGTELVGRVIQASLDELSWSKSKDSLKLIIVAGNESADQDKVVNFRDVCKRAIESGAMVNSIYCGNPADDIAPGWKEVALRADGHFASIDHNRGTVSIATPFDARIAELSTAMNATYIPLGTEGKKGWVNQRAQDLNANKLGKAVEAQRAKSKASALYFCSWCLVDAYRAKQVDLDKIEQKDLPKELQGKSKEELIKVIDANYKKRVELQKQVAELNKKRSEFVNAEMKKKNLSDDKAFDKVVRSAIRAQAARKGYAFEEEK
jgi:hypothetical protein